MPRSMQEPRNEDKGSILMFISSRFPNPALPSTFPVQFGLLKLFSFSSCARLLLSFRLFSRTPSLPFLISFSFSHGAFLLYFLFSLARPLLLLSLTHSLPSPSFVHSSFLTFGSLSFVPSSPLTLGSLSFFLLSVSSRPRLSLFFLSSSHLNSLVPTPSLSHSHDPSLFSCSPCNPSITLLLFIPFSASPPSLSQPLFSIFSWLAALSLPLSFFFFSLYLSYGPSSLSQFFLLLLLCLFFSFSFSLVSQVSQLSLLPLPCCFVPFPLF